LKTQLCFGLVALAVMMGCAKDPKVVIASYDHEKFLREKVKYEPEIGKNLWVHPRVSVHETGEQPRGRMYSRCSDHKAATGRN
jgi:hypothetical protein